MTAGQTPSSLRRWYHRKRTYAAAMLGLIVAIILILFTLLHWAPEWMIHQAIARTNAPIAISRIQWAKDGMLELKYIRMPGGERETSFLKIRTVRLKWNWFDILFNHHLDVVELDKPEIWVAKLNAAMEKMSSGSGGGSLGNWSLGTLRISSGTLTLDNLGADIPALPITVGQARPLELHDIRLANGETEGIDREQTATIENLTIVSPYDPMSPVLSFKAINLIFTWDELSRSEIRRVELIGPIIYLGPDLFQFVDHFSQKRDETRATKTALPWKVHEFDIRAGQLAINVFGQAGVTLPFTFVSHANDIQLDQLDKMTINNKILIPSQDRFYPEYKVRWEELQGEIGFSLPLGSNSKNLVNTVKVKMISWNDLQMTDAWSSVTFDRNGIYGRMEGKSYNGYLSTDFSIFFKSGFPWEGHFFAKGVNVGPIAEKLASTYLSLGGVLDGKLNINGQATEVIHSGGSLKLRAPGVMEIKSVNDLIQKMPDDWGQIKRDLVTILLESFRTYNYTKGELMLDYTPPSAVGALRLSGLQGDRNFTVRWHQGQHSSEVAKSKSKR